MGVTSSPVVPGRRGSVTSRAVILAVVLALLVVTLAMPVRSWLAQRAEISGLQADVEAARQRVASLTIERQRWNDPAFVAAEARRRLHFVMPGEVGYTTLGVDGKPVIEAEATAKALAQMSWYQRMWAAMQEADNAADPGGLTQAVATTTEATPADATAVVPSPGADAPAD